MKRIITFLLCAGLILSFAACGRDKKGARDPQERTLYTTEATTQAPPTTIPFDAYPTAPAFTSGIATTGTTVAETTDLTTDPLLTSDTTLFTLPALTTAPTTAAPQTTVPAPATVPASTAAPTTAAPTTAPTTAKQNVCTISVECSKALSDASLVSVLPSGGVILPAKRVEFREGESVFDVLQRVCRENGVPMEFSMAPIYNTAYIEGIGNLYEFDGGSMSGWMYCVNGVYPNYGCSKYTVKSGDVIEWHYTMDLGADLGAKEVEQN